MKCFTQSLAMCVVIWIALIMLKNEM